MTKILTLLRRLSGCVPHFSGGVAALLAIMCLFVQTASAQTKTVTANLKGVTYEQVFQEIKRQTGYSVFYNNGQIDESSRVDLEVRGLSATETLARLFDGTNLSYSVVGNQIVVTRRENAGRAYTAGATVPITIRVTDRSTKKPLVGVVCYFPELGVSSVTNAEGIASFRNIPSGRNSVQARLIGYNTFNTSINIGAATSFHIAMEETTLAINNITVLGVRTENTLTTSTTIERQAIDHLQALTLADLFELIPGELHKGTNITAPQTVKLRNINPYDTGSSFGTGIIVDGVQLSNNAVLDSQVDGGYNTVGYGVDLRQISTDDIETVEIITGVPSAEYGDITAGAVIVKTRVGYTPLQIRGKISPGIKQVSASKGWRVTDSGSFLNLSVDYMTGSDDPRNKSESLDRVNASIGYTTNISKTWHATTRLRMSGLMDWSGNDPDATDNGTRVKSNNYNFVFSHNGDISFNKLLSRKFTYTLGVQYNYIDQHQRKIVTNSTSVYPIFTSTEDGIYQAVLLPNSYMASGGTKSEPFTFNAKVGNSFFIKSGGVMQRFNMGIEYKFEDNFGKGNYNDDPELPLDKSLARTRSFKDIPSISTISAYLEDNIEFRLWNRPFKMQAGVRYMALQPFKSERVSSLSPRVNLRYDAADWIGIRAAFGMMSKTPGLNILYPENRYHDIKIVNYTPNATEEQLVMYSTKVIIPSHEGLKNSTNTRWELGFDFTIAKDTRFSVTGYHDYNPNGFESLSEYTGFLVGTYDIGTGYTPVSGTTPTLDFLDENYTGGYARSAYYYASSGRYGNTGHARSMGVEFTMNFPRIKVLNTDVSLSGAYHDSESWSSDRSYSNLKVNGSTTVLSGVENTFFGKVEYEAGTVRSIYRRFATSLNVVYNIPSLRMVASGRLQVDWYNYSRSLNPGRNPIGYFYFTEVDGQVVQVYEKITQEMLDDPEYTIQGGLLSDQVLSGSSDQRPSIYKPLFVFNLRLTKEIGDFAGFSFYANNATFYNPWQTTNKSKTKSERNSDINFGFELTFKF